MSEINSTHLDRTGAVPRATVVIVITRAVLAAALAGALATLVAACQNEGPATQTRRQAVQTADPDEAAFLAASGAPLPWSDAPPISLRRSPTGTVSAVFGSELSVQQQSLGCLAAGPEAAARCFLGAFAGSFGIGNVIDQLGTGEDRTRAGGIRVVRFGQVHEGRPVFGRHIDVVMNQGLEVIGAFSTLALPLDAPPATSVQAALAAYQPGIAGDLVRASTGVDDLTEEASHATLWPVLSGDRYQAVAAMAVVYGSASRERRVLALVDATTSAVLEVRSQTATDLPVRDMRGFAVHDQMDGHSFHLECDDDDDCEGTNWFCSDQFDPKRCVARCLTDADCDDF